VTVVIFIFVVKSAGATERRGGGKVVRFLLFLLGAFVVVVSSFFLVSLCFFFPVFLIFHLFLSVYGCVLFKYTITLFKLLFSLSLSRSLPLYLSLSRSLPLSPSLPSFSFFSSSSSDFGSEVVTAIRIHMQIIIEEVGKRARGIRAVRVVGKGVGERDDRVRNGGETGRDCGGSEEGVPR